MFFRRRKNKNVPADDKVAGRIAGWMILVQRRWAVMMSKLVSRIPIRKKKWMVILFAGICCSYSLFLIAGSITGRMHSGFNVQSIQRPKYVVQPGDDSVKVLLSRPEKLKMQRFVKFMDSLQKTESGKIIYDSIQRYRPGLLDSVLQILRYEK